MSTSFRLRSASNSNFFICREEVRHIPCVGTRTRLTVYCRCQLRRRSGNLREWPHAPTIASFSLTSTSCEHSNDGQKVRHLGPTLKVFHDRTIYAGYHRSIRISPSRKLIPFHCLPQADCSCSNVSLPVSCSPLNLRTSSQIHTQATPKAKRARTTKANGKNQ